MEYFTFLSNFSSLVETGLYLRNLTIVNVAMAMKKQLIEYKYKAPAKNLKLKVASPNPAVHKGGISAVAIATPGIGFPFSTRVIEIIPTIPPMKAIKTS